MNGYSKISTTTANSNTHKSRSIDFSDFFSFPQTTKPSSRNNTASSKPEEIARNKLQLQVKKTNSPERELDEGVNGNGERFGVILGRSGSVSSSTSGFQAIMKRAFSMRRSSSVSERYCRIHDQYMAIASPIADEIDGDGNGIGTTRSMKKKIFRACKRLLGL